VTDYDRIPYPSAPLPHTHPYFLGGLALQHGLDVPKTTRVLDVGCGAGRNLCWIAATMPTAVCVGVDLAGSAIADARGFAARIQLGNVKFLQADFRETPAGEFDYIIANGLYSWTPPDVRAALLQLIDERLSPLGIALVSFHHENRPWRDSLMKIADPQARLREARELLGLEDFEDGVLLHDHLAEISEPVSGAAFVAALPKGLEFMTEAREQADFHDAVVFRSGRVMDVPMFDKMWFVTESSYPATVEDCEDTVVEVYSGPREIVSEAGEYPVAWAPARILARDGEREVMNYFGALVELEDEDRALLVSLDGTRPRDGVPAETLEFFAKAGLLTA
jgi:SAM-dependent methyltransferase